MCGIVGVIGHQHLPKIDDVRKALATLVHRGPDDLGFYEDQLITLGHRRLAIFDLSEAAGQPMTIDGVTLLFNGAIFNFRQLRESLIGAGHRFQSDSDTEVILRSYLQNGIESLKQFNGQWAFALWDSRQSQLYLSRDRFGIKPMYLWQTPYGLAFASEIKALTKLPSWKAKMNHGVTCEWLAAGRHAHRDQTLFEGVNRLGAGMYAVVDPGSLDVKYHRYYDCRSHINERVVSEDATREFEHVLEDAIAIRTASDRKLGASLSGGIDSSLVTSRCVAHLGNELPVFSIVYPEASSSEKPFVDLVVEHCQLKQFTSLAPTFADFQKDEDDLIWHHEGPIGGFGVYAQYCLHRAAKESQVQVMLGGQGADEILGGYPRFFFPQLKRTLLRNPWKAWSDWKEIRSRFEELRPLGWKELRSFVAWPNRSPKWLKIDSAHAEAFRPKSTSIREISLALLSDMGLQTLLHYEDKNAMAHGIESRVPYLDHRVVELALSLADQSKVNGLWTKYDLRQMAAKHLPAQIAWRTDKLGFHTPAKQWMSAHRQHMINYVKKSERVHLIVEMDQLPWIGETELFRIYTFAKWCNIFEVTP